MNGWQDVTEVELVDFLKKYIGDGLKKVICTDIAKDGMLQGPSVELYREIMQKVEGVYLGLVRWQIFKNWREQECQPLFSERLFMKVASRLKKCAK